MSVLWNHLDAALATGGATTRSWEATGVSIDTRTLQPGDLFVALKDARDGHEFVADALEKGAAAALVTHRPDGVPADAPLLVVPEVLPALEALGKFARARTQARVIAVTGSVGKTSTKEMLRIVLSCQGRTHASVASYNNHWGVPLTLARMPADTQYAVIEIGMSNPGEIAPLSILARPHVALVTTIAPAHMEAFGSIDGIAREKASICEGLEPGGTAIMNADLDTSDILFATANTQSARTLGFGMNGADWTLDDVRVTAEATVIRAHHEKTPFLFKLSTPGRHFAMNALGALAASTAAGADAMTAALDLAKWLPPAGRGTREKVTIDGARSGEWFELIDDAFNANPASMSAALEVLAATEPRDGIGRVSKGRRIAFLGDMLELGEEEAELHAELSSDIAMKDVAIVHCAGPLMEHLWNSLPQSQRGHWFETSDELAHLAPRLVDSGDVVLVKGSKGSYVSRVVDALRKMGQAEMNNEKQKG